MTLPELSNFAWDVLSLVQDRNDRGATVGHINPGTYKALLNCGAIREATEERWTKKGGYPVRITDHGREWLAQHKAAKP